MANEREERWRAELRCVGCGAHCYRFRPGDDEYEREPCWGEVKAVDEVDYGEPYGWETVHACAGHDECYDGGVYEAKP